MELLKVNERLSKSVAHDSIVTMAYEYRQKKRVRTALDNGEDVGIFLPSGGPLRGGDLLRAEDGRVIKVRAALEAVSKVVSEDFHLLAKAAYHLGNRHVLLQFGDGWLRYLRDTVLDEMLTGLGLRVRHEMEAFEPEPGAYHDVIGRVGIHD